MLSFDFIAAAIGLILTLLVFSYLIGDNPLFRLAIYLFIGVSSGYAVAAIWQYVLLPKLITPLQSGNANESTLAIIPAVLCLSLLAKLSPRISSVGSVAMAILVGVGSATAVAGAVLGTLIPQAQAAMTFGSGAMGFLEGVVMLAGTVLVLGSFQFTASRAPDGTVKQNIIVKSIAFLGRLFIAVTLGVLFAGVYMAALTALIERLNSVIRFIRPLLGI